MMPVMIDHEEYLNADEAAAFTGYSRNWFVKEIVPRHNIKQYQKGVHRSMLYKKSELEPLVRLRPVQEPEK